MQWYQTRQDVTVCLVTNGIDKRKISAKFDRNKCIIKAADTGVLIWACDLQYPVQPENCKIKPAGKRLEVRLRKLQTGESWSSVGQVLQKDQLDHTSCIADPETNSHTADTVVDEKEPEDVKCDTDEEGPFFTPIGSPSDMLADSFGKMSIKTDGMDKVVSLSDVPLEYTDKDGVVLVNIQVPQVTREQCSVIFNRQSIEVQFVTINNVFLSCRPNSSENTRFKWSVNLYDAINLEQCSYSVTDMCIVLSLTKHNRSITWKSLEKIQPKHELPLKSTTPTTEQDQSCDSPINDLDATVEVDVNNNSKSVYISNEFNPFKLASNLSSTSKPVSENHVSTTNQQNKSTETSNCIPSKAVSDGKITSNDLKTCQNASTSPARSSSATVDQKRTIVPLSMYRLKPDPFTSPSYTGIANLGNTCFMSSVLQCLSNTVEIRDYFLGEFYKRDINLVNPLGHKGILAECFSACLRSLWSGDSAYITPLRLKSVIGSINDRFGGYSQQDAHEFNTFFLDALHEDLNRVKHKPQTKQLECDDKEDTDLADESWDQYKCRNDSLLVDLFGGQFKSTLVCPTCQKVSVTFDPFMSVSVPLPKKTRNFSVVFMAKDPQCPPQQVVLSLSPDGTLELLKASVARKTGIPMINLRVFEAYRGKVHSMMSDNQQPLSKINDKDIVIVSEVLSRVDAKEDVKEINVIIRLQYIPSIDTCSRRECGKGSADLKRCTRCKTVAYCNMECQKKDWSEHKLKCKTNTSIPVAFPFIISLPVSRITYNSLTECAVRFARRFIDYSHQPQTSTAQATAPSFMYYLMPVNKFGENLPDIGPLEDTGDKPVTLVSNYLAMDWRNNPKEADHVKVTMNDCTMIKPVGSTAQHTFGSATIHLEDCLQLFTEPEELPKDNAWYCPRCKEHREATKQMSIWRLPPLLIINLKRFSFQNYIWRDKIDKPVIFPIKELDMAPFLLGEAATNLSTPPIYDLYATVNHYGSVYIGHYMATAKPPMEMNSTVWLKYDDDSVFKTQSENQVQCKEAYILFYRRRTI